MTAEVALLNKRAVALAADSAVTYRGRGKEKIFESANKIFALSKYHPVGVMVYGGAEIMEVPWETVIKQYRADLGEASFPTIKDYASDFMSFLENHSVLNDQASQTRQAQRILYTNLAAIFQHARERAEQVLEETDSLSHEELRQVVKTVVEFHHRRWKSIDEPASNPDGYSEAVADRYADLIQQYKEEKFEGLLTSTSSRWLRETAEFLLARVSPMLDQLGAPGVVFAGFGSSETFPSLYSCYVRGILADHLQRVEDTRKCIDVGPGNTRGAAIPFAQEDVVQTFLEGIDPNFKREILEGLSRVATELPSRIIDGLDELTEQEKEQRKDELGTVGAKEIRGLFRDMERYRRREHTDPIVETISVLPKDELAEAASSLVQLTSFKRHVSVDQSETVKGPIDVVVISKGDGLIWIDRKHYFSPELNHHFFENYFRSRETSDNEPAGEEDE